MKKILGVFLLVVILVLVACFYGTGQSEDVQYLRIHIRANSNLAVDQEVKYKVKDEVVEALIPLVSDATTFELAKEILEKNLTYIENVANSVLAQNGFEYTSSATIGKEEFPTRKYEDLVFESGVYDALVLNLGTGSGDNWWCVVYPPLCFTQSKNSTNFVYISKILEIIKSITKS